MLSQAEVSFWAKTYLSMLRHDIRNLERAGFLQKRMSQFFLYLNLKEKCLTTPKMTCRLLLALCIFLLATRANAQTTITHCQALQDINLDLAGSYALTNNIDCSGSISWNGGLGFKPIGENQAPFAGSLDGQGYTVYNLSINRPHESEVALFGYLSVTAYLHSICLDLVNVRGDEKVGSLAGHNEGFIANSNITGTVMGGYQVGGAVGINLGAVTEVGVQVEVAGTVPGWRVGGLVGQNQGTLTHCTAVGEVMGATYVGGAVGISFNLATLVGIRAKSNVTGMSPGTEIGGLIGQNQGALMNATSTGKVIGTRYIGGVAGRNLGTLIGIYAWVDVTGISPGEYVGGLAGDNVGSLTDCTAIGKVVGSYLVAGAVGLNSGELNLICFQGDVTGIGLGLNIGGLIGQHAGVGRLINSIAVVEVTGITYVGGAIGLNFAELIDIHIQGNVTGTNEGQNIGGIAGYNGWIVTDSSIIGVVTGNYRVGGLSGFNQGVVSLSQAYGAVFGEDTTTGGLVGDNSGTVLFSTAFNNVTGVSFVGGLVGNNQDTIEDCQAYGSTVSGEIAVGGLIGQNSGTILRSVSNATVTGTGSRIGGAVGDNTAEGFMHQCTASGEVHSVRDNVGGLVGLNAGHIHHSIALGPVSGEDNVGGLIGRQTQAGLIETCYATGRVDAMGDQVGGLIGENDGLVQDCYTLSAVSGRKEVGGLIGHGVGIHDQLIRSYAAGCVRSKGASGGLMGSRAVGQFTRCYWDTHTTAQAFPAGKSGSFGLRPYGKGTYVLYQAETFREWDFENQWTNVPGESYPFHRALVPEVLPVEPDETCPRKSSIYEDAMPWIRRIIILASGTLWLLMLWRRYKTSERINAMQHSPHRLAWMADMGDLPLVQALWQKGCAATAREAPGGHSAIALAARGGHLPVVRYLCDGAKLGEHKATQCQAAFQAAKHYRQRIVVSFLQKIVSVQQGEATTEVIEAQEEMASAVLLSSAAEQGQGCRMRTLREKTDPDLCRPEGYPPLLGAAARGHFNLALWLVTGGADPFARNSKAQTALALAMAQGKRVAAYHLMTTGSKADYWLLSVELHLVAIQWQLDSYTTVDLSGRCLSDVELQRLVDALDMNHKITAVNLAYNNITSLGLRYWAEKLAQHPTIVTLDVSFNAVGEKGVVALKQALSDQPTLQAVVLTGNELLAPSQRDWEAFQVPPLGCFDKIQATLYRVAVSPYALLGKCCKGLPELDERVMVKATLWLKRHQVTTHIGFFFGVLGKILDTLLILELDENHQSDLALVSVIFLVLATCIVGGLGLHLMYKVSLPRPLGVAGWIQYILHSIGWMCTLPILSDDLVRLEIKANYVDTQLALLRVANFLLEDLPQFSVSLIYLLRQGMNEVVVIRLVVTAASSFAAALSILYNQPSLHKMVRDLKEAMAFLRRD